MDSLSLSMQEHSYSEIVAAMVRHPALASGNCRELARAFFPEIARQVHVDRIGLWLLKGKGPILGCVELYDLRIERFLADSQLNGAEYQIEINREQHEEAMLALRPARDSRLRRYAKRYLNTIGITDLLDASIGRDKCLQGIVGLECVGRERPWTAVDEQFVIHVAELFTLALSVSKGIQRVHLQDNWIHLGRSLAGMLEILQATKDLEQAAPAALAHLGNSGWADRIALCRNQLDDSGIPGFVVQYFWHKEGLFPLFEKKTEWTDYDLFAKSFRKNLLERQVMIAGRDRGNPALQAWLKLRSAQIALAVPVFVDQEFYGFLFLEKENSMENGPERTGYLTALLGDIWSMAIRRSRMYKEQVLLQEELSRVEQSHRTDLATTGNSSEQARLFIADISHRIRTTLNGIVGLFGLPMDDEKRQRHYSQVFQQSCDQLLEQLDELTGYFTTEFPKSNPENMEFDLREAIEDIAELMALKMHDKSLEISYVMDSEVPWKLRGNSVRIRQLLIHLLGQMVKRMEQGEIFIHVKAQEWGSGRVLVDMEISTNDCAVVILQQSAAPTDSEFEMTIARRLIRQMEGDIGFERRDERNVRFQFSWWSEFLAEDQDECLSSWSGTQALIADASPHHRQALASQLELWGISSLGVSTAEEALEALQQADFREQSYSLVFLDRDLASLVIQQLADAADWQKQIPVWVLTASLDRGRGVLEEAERMNFSAFLARPVRRRNLQTILEKNLQDFPYDEQALEIRTGSGRKRTPHILVAEDNLINQLVAKAILGNLGCVANIVDNGQAALDALTKHTYDLILMDCQMPVMDGYEATRKIRSAQIKEIDPGIPIVAMTGKALPGDRERCLECGMDDYISKPILVNELRLALDRYTKKSGIARRAACELFDERELMERLMGDRILGRMVLEGFLEDVPELLERMSTTIRETDYAGVASVAQAIQTAASNIGAHVLMELALKVKKQSTWNQITVLSIQMQQEFARLRQELEERFSQW